MPAPANSAEFDRVYRSPFMHWVWGDVRIPPEIKALVRDGKSALELGCGVGRFSRYAAQAGLRVTGVDFSAVAIAKARAAVADDAARPEFRVGDVTRLEGLQGPFDVSFDVGCFHCLDAAAQPGYVSALARVLRPGGIHLVWALDSAPSDDALSPAAMGAIFAADFELRDARRSRRRLAASHWYWLVRRG